MKRVLNIKGLKKYPKEDWQYEVLNGDTQLSYAEWVEHRIESDKNDES